ncbi:MAG: ATP-dependent DNA helicase UvrD2, partial [Candidatus Limnocylindrales bacterium]
WPQVHGRDAPAILDGKARLLGPLKASLPGGYRYLSVRDLAAEIEWAKARRIDAASYRDQASQAGREPPLPADLMAGLYRRYEMAKERAGLIDFEDMLERTVTLIEQHETIAEAVRERYRWFSVDEYQDTNPLQAALLSAWLGERDDLAVVGDEDQTIFTFTGASSDHLIEFRTRFPSARVVHLASNYRSSPQILELANRVLAAGRAAADERRPGSPPRPAKRLDPCRPEGPQPVIRGFATDDLEAGAMIASMTSLAGNGVPLAQMAVLVRTNAQLPAIEAALGRAGIPFHVRGERFFARPEVRRAIAVANGLARRTDARGARAGEPAVTDRSAAVTLPARLAAAFAGELGVPAEDAPANQAARERHAAVSTLLQLAEDLVASDPEADLATFLEDVGRRAAAEAEGGASGVELLTYHRAKGLEWEAVYLPALEDGLLPIRQATDPEARAEERRLLYVGITRARRHLWLSWASRRTGSAGRETQRARSPFLDGLLPADATGPIRSTPTAPAGTTRTEPGDRSPLSLALRAWRTERARTDKVAPYIVFHDATLEAIASLRPRSPADLRRIAGIGPLKLDRYGDDIIAIVVRARDN